MAGYYKKLLTTSQHSSCNCVTPRWPLVMNEYNWMLERKHELNTAHRFNSYFASNLAACPTHGRAVAELFSQPVRLYVNKTKSVAGLFLLLHKRRPTTIHNWELWTELTRELIEQNQVITISYDTLFTRNEN